MRADVVESLMATGSELSEVGWVNSYGICEIQNCTSVVLPTKNLHFSI
jgi:hypothetical protein